MNSINYFPKKEKLQELLAKLPKKDTTLIVADFDDTIFSRYEQLNGTDEISILLQNNRGNKGNEVIRDTITIEKLITMYYENKIFPKTIIEKINPKQDLILTAGFTKIQKAKIQATNLSHIPLEIVLHSSDKPQRLVEYIIQLGYIPATIEVYEDKTKHFEAAKEETQQLTNSILEIYFVEMKNNQTPPKITKL